MANSISGSNGSGAMQRPPTTPSSSNEAQVRSTDGRSSSRSSMESMNFGPPSRPDRGKAKVEDTTPPLMPIKFAAQGAPGASTSAHPVGRSSSAPPGGGSPLLPSDHERSDRFSEITLSSATVSMSVHGGSFHAAADIESLDRHPVNSLNRVSAEFLSGPGAAGGWRAKVANVVDRILGRAAEGLTSTQAAATHAAVVTVKFVGSAANAGVATLANTALEVFAAAGGVLPRDFRVTGAAVGHLVHQTAAVAVPTLVREVAKDALLLGVKDFSGAAIIGMEAGIFVAAVAQQAVRVHRERQHPDAAARGAANLTEPQWNALSLPEQLGLRATYAKKSGTVTALAVVGASINLTLTIVAVARGDVRGAATIMANDAKMLAYAPLRDSVQATFRMVSHAQETPGGLSGAHLEAAANNYKATNLLANLALFTTLPSAAAPRASAARNQLQGMAAAGAARMSNAGVWTETLKENAVKAAINTLVETQDWHTVTELDAKASGTVQRWDPAIKARAQDYGRVLDQSAARVGSILPINAASNLIAKVISNPSVQALVSGVVAGEMAGRMYDPVSQAFQADGAVRQARVDEEARSSGRPSPQRQLTIRR